MALNNFFPQRIMPAVTLDDSSKAIPVAKSLLAGGITTFEITFRTSAAAKSIKLIKSEFPELIIGAGTILSVNELEIAIKAGAHFALAPGFNPSIVKKAQQLEFPFIPGVMTPSEVEQGLNHGCMVQKLFPASLLGGVDYLSALYNPYQHTGIKFIPMGGVTIENLSAYLACPAVIAVGGSWIASKKLIDKEDYHQIEKNSLEAVNTEVKSNL